MSTETVTPLAERQPVTTWRQILAIVGAAVLTLAALIPVALGVTAGAAFYALRWLAAAVAEGFAIGNRSDDA